MIAMNRAEFRVLREALGLTGAEVAQVCGVGARAVRRWEQGGSRIGEEFVQPLMDLASQTDREVARLVTRTQRMRHPRIVTYGTDEAFAAEHPDSTRSAQWHRAVSARAARQVPGSVVVFAEDL